MINIIIVCSGANNECLGHEVHITRCIIIDMLLKGYIKSNDIIVTKKDRKFLYTLLFNNVCDIDDFNKNHSIHLSKRNDINIINLNEYTTGAATGNITNYKNFIFNKKYYTEEFKNKLLNIEYIDTKYDDNYNNDYVLIHHRYADNIDNLKKICYKIHNVYGADTNIIIFNNNINNLSTISNKNIILINNLQIYASYLNGYNSKYKCKLFITEWSGGGQLSQYCYSGNSLYYFNNYNSIDYINRFDYIKENVMKCSYFDWWDFKNPSNSNYKLFINLDELLNNIV
jgi:hypothetical protein